MVHHGRPVHHEGTPGAGAATGAGTDRLPALWRPPGAARGPSSRGPGLRPSPGVAPVPAVPQLGGSGPAPPQLHPSRAHAQPDRHVPHQPGAVPSRAVRGPGTQDVRQLLQSGREGVLRWGDLPSRDRWLHDPGRRSYGDRPGRTGIHHRGRVRAGAHPRRSRDPVDGETLAQTPVARSSSSPSHPPPGWIASTPSSAGSSKGWMWCEPSGR